MNVYCIAKKKLLHNTFEFCNNSEFANYTKWLWGNWQILFLKLSLIELMYQLNVFHLKSSLSLWDFNGNYMQLPEERSLVSDENEVGGHYLILLQDDAKEK